MDEVHIRRGGADIVTFPGKQASGDWTVLPIEKPSPIVSNVMASDREYIDLKLEAAEARTEARFVELNGKFDRLFDNIAAMRSDFDANRFEVRADYKSTRTTIIVTVVGTGIALAALLVSVMTYGDAIFSRGIQIRDVVNSAVTEIEAKRAPQTVTPSQQQPNTTPRP
ncbi:hypothetical protein [Microvirga zambiensis]|uniref:hypothetical protein n=1 Tax=Microvirga zambiensis TaxID=1402137 RepID=UPI00191FC103|nr:hypothetical protein [Microvirga zambiensis]